MTFPHNTKYDADTLDRIAELWALGLKAHDIGRRLRIPKNSICRLARTARLNGDPRFPARNAGRLRGALKPKARHAPCPARKAALPRRRPTKVEPILAREVHLRIWELRERQCRYPVRETDTREHLFCAKTTEEYQSYHTAPSTSRFVVAPRGGRRDPGARHDPARRGYDPTGAGVSSVHALAFSVAPTLCGLIVKPERQARLAPPRPALSEDREIVITPDLLDEHDAGIAKLKALQQ